jgi:hypothetical protein
MIAELTNGINHRGANRLPSTSNDDSDNVCHNGPQPSPNGSNGARHGGAPPSTNGGNGVCHEAATPSTDGDNGRDASGRLARPVVRTG